MKKIKMLTAVLLSLLLVTFLISGCQTILVSKNGETETGKTETRQYDFSEFTRVDISSAFSYEIMQSDTYSISITANNNLFDDIKVAKEGQTLIIGMEIPGAPWAIFNTIPSLKAVITMPHLQGLESSGATRGTVTGFSSSEELDVTASGASTVEILKIATGDVTFEVSGASEVTGDIEAKNMELEVSGASSVQLKGSSGSIAAGVSGASHLKLADLKVENANVILSGASNGTVNLEGKLDAELSGASTLEYIGEPTLGTMVITGSSKLKKNNL
ncbi:head GIN domain-containing protein [Chloroflexota bacterium]